MDSGVAGRSMLAEEWGVCVRNERGQLVVVFSLALGQTARCCNAVAAGAGCGVV